MSTGAWVLVAAVLVALGFGLHRALTDGRFRGTRRVRGVGDTAPRAESAPISVLEGTPWAGQLGERATLLQFSSAFCAPCRAARRVLRGVADQAPGIAHVEVDAEQHLDVVRRLGILRTPTTLILSEHGVEITRATGAPTRHQVLSVLGRAEEAL